jgi:hypothetical protein
MNRNNGNSHRNGHRDQMGTKISNGLGWFSIALGAAELLATRSITRALGMRGDETLVRLYGVRELATGVGLLTTRDPVPWLWGRVAGDALDLGTLGVRFSQRNPKRDTVGMVLANVAVIAALDVFAAQRTSSKSRKPAILHDYSNRSGLPRPPEQMRGAARDFQVPREMREPVTIETHRDFDRNPKIK